ncbi:UDP-N-acetylmuramate dehydrogenase [Acidicapsa acidisoli]|uniref:UDP-N-acetylmuramate dehydrogenase n=1 Tax=Acidicapsa acidisoli TaxID=1615681 RepID=UPI0021E001B3|nr:UDP-N-acetylmuramate dehydrogenase [Acidicapsa acidisoli]
MKIQENVALAPFTTFGIGGPARWFAEAASEAEIVDAVTWARERLLPLFVLGGGSNLLISDAGFAGLVLRMALKGVEAEEDGGRREFRVAAGEDWDGFVQRAVAEKCSGIECLAGIPGSVGGTPVQNVGAYGQEVSETIERVRVLDLESLNFQEMSGEACGFAYRSSVFNSSAKGRYLVLRVDYRLTPGGKANLRYADLQRVFSAGSDPVLAEIAAEVRRIRLSKGMLLVDGDENCRSAGSFFKNPIVSMESFEELTARLGKEPPHYPAGAGQVKLPAAWLIEQAGFPKGFRLGRAGISSRHTLALVNLGGASASDILALRDLIVGRLARDGIALTMEPVLVGF